jgi:hypothetical protein
MVGGGVAMSVRVASSHLSDAVLQSFALLVGERERGDACGQRVRNYGADC